MYSTIQATFDKSKSRYVRAVMKKLKLDEDTSVKRISIGQLFNEMTACIIVPEEKLHVTLQILIANDIKIYLFDNEFKKVVDDVIKQPKGEGYYSKGWIHNDRLITKESVEKILFEPKIPVKVKNEINEKLDAAVKSLDQKGGSSQTIENLVKEGNYKAIKNWMQNDPLHNEDAGEKYIKAIRNYININMQKGMDNISNIDTAILKLCEIVSDENIKKLTNEDFINIASNAILFLSAEINPPSLIDVINLQNVGQKLNVMAAIKLSELIFENELQEDNLLAQATGQINKRYLQICYDFMETTISELNKIKFNRLIEAIIAMRKL
jgi:hypothetical protein